MRTIRRLPQAVVDVIAAGQVADRPAAVVKELIENALDAGAQQITIALQAGGVQKISVVDDGQGMKLADLQLAYQSHTTSKLYSLEELHTVGTLGFRGEALASIAAVSQLTIATRWRQDAHGHKVTVTFEQLGSEPQPVGMPIGTQIIVEQLFARVPARKKFLKSAAVEYRQILQVISSIAIAHPSVGFSLTHNKERTLTLSPVQSSVERLAMLLNTDKPQLFSTVNISHPYIRGQLSLGHPSVAERTAQHQYIFVNGRRVVHPPLHKVIRDSYATVLEPKAVPVYMAELHVDPGLVDVNVNPGKTAVRFADESMVISAVGLAAREGVEQALVPTDATGVSAVEQAFGMDKGIANRIRHGVKSWFPAAGASIDESSIIQVARTYLVVPSELGMLLIDQHAAHEAILYRQFTEAVHDKQSSSKRLTLEKPLVIELPLLHWQALQEVSSSLEALGIAVSFVQATHQVIVHEIPQLLEGYPLRELLIELTDQADSEQSSSGQLDQTMHRTVAYLACRTAIKAGDVLTREQMVALTREVRGNPHALTCPHGRPTQQLISVEELEKLFRRR
ncbi:DNA mismatch repair endonuclease MutL [Candidatus Woesebacteria bacterium]|nr:DNA mismatch repair endonuclease MutL [Candidatus Woesebacteria bacterium]